MSGSKVSVLSNNCGILACSHPPYLYAAAVDAELNQDVLQPFDIPQFTTLSPDIQFLSRHENNSAIVTWSPTHGQLGLLFTMDHQAIPSPLEPEQLEAARDLAWRPLACSLCDARYPPLQALWNPMFPDTFTVLSRAGLAVYEVPEAAASAPHTPISPVDTLRFSNAVQKFNIQHAAFGYGTGWDGMALHLAGADGDLFTICPWVPPGATLTASAHQALSKHLQGCREVLLHGSDVATLEGQRATEEALLTAEQWLEACWGRVSGHEDSLWQLQHAPPSSIFSLRIRPCVQGPLPLQGADTALASTGAAAQVCGFAVMYDASTGVSGRAVLSTAGNVALWACAMPTLPRWAQFTRLGEHKQAALCSSTGSSGSVLPLYEPWVCCDALQLAERSVDPHHVRLLNDEVRPSFLHVVAGGGVWTLRSWLPAFHTWLTSKERDAELAHTLHYELLPAGTVSHLADAAVLRGKAEGQHSMLLVQLPPDGLAQSAVLTCLPIVAPYSRRPVQAPAAAAAADLGHSADELPPFDDTVSLAKAVVSSPLLKQHIDRVEEDPATSLVEAVGTMESLVARLREVRDNAFHRALALQHLASALADRLSEYHTKSAALRERLEAMQRRIATAGAAQPKQCDRARAVSGTLMLCQDRLSAAEQQYSTDVQRWHNEVQGSIQPQLEFVKQQLTALERGEPAPTHAAGPALATPTRHGSGVGAPATPRSGMLRSALGGTPTSTWRRRGARRGAGSDAASTASTAPADHLALATPTRSGAPARGTHAARTALATPVHAGQVADLKRQAEQLQRELAHRDAALQVVNGDFVALVSHVFRSQAEQAATKRDSAARMEQPYTFSSGAQRGWGGAAVP